MIGREFGFGREKGGGGTWLVVMLNKEDVVDRAWVLTFRDWKFLWRQKWLTRRAPQTGCDQNRGRVAGRDSQLQYRAIWVK